jgi:hypothetical protein
MPHRDVTADGVECCHTHVQRSGFFVVGKHWPHMWSQGYSRGQERGRGTESRREKQGWGVGIDNPPVPKTDTQGTKS